MAQAGQPDRREEPVRPATVGGRCPTVDHEHVLGHRQLGEELGMLERPAQPTRPSPGRPYLAKLLAGEVDAALDGCPSGDSGERVDEGRLARPVGTDDGDHLAGSEGHRDSLDRPQSAEADSETLDGHECALVGVRRLPASAQAWRPRTPSPCSAPSARSSPSSGPPARRSQGPRPRAGRSGTG